MNPFSSSDFLGWLFAASWQLALLIGLVAVATRLLRHASPRLRHALWLLVLLKALLPTSLSTDWSIGRLGVAPVAEQVASAVGWEATIEPPSTTPDIRSEPSTDATDSSGLPGLIVVAWATGAVGVWLFVAIGYTRLRQRTNALPEVDEGPLRVALEEAAMRIADGDASAVTTVDLRIDAGVSAPFLFGFRRPRIVLPQRLADGLNADELRAVLAHELLHWRRRDTWIGWLQAVVQGLFWFHPLVWWAATQMRHERECACDEAVLRRGVCEPATYGDAIIHTLKAARGAAPPAAPLVGVFEHGSLLQQRLEEVMSYSPEKRRFGWLSRLALAAFAMVALPMASQGRDATAETGAAAAVRSDSPFPVIAESIPEIGATEVDPSLNEIRVAFDRDMNTSDMSWTGGGDEFPYVDESRQAKWIDARTCVLPVKLKKGAFYRVGINAKSYQNFKSADGKPAEHRVLSFSTKGAKRSVMRKAHVPEIVELSPPLSATDVDPSTERISVEFDTRMGGGMSWVRSGGTFPGTENGRAKWSKDGRTCTLPVELVPGTTYRLSLNGSHYVNFQSKSGVPLTATEWSFSTRAE